MFIRPCQFRLPDPTGNFLFLIRLVQLVAAVIWSLQIYSISAFSLRLDISAVGWTSRLDGELDASSRQCTGHHGEWDHVLYTIQALHQNH